MADGMNHSSVFRRIDWFYYYIIHTSRTLLLEGELYQHPYFSKRSFYHTQLTRDDASVSRTLNRAALALAVYGGLIFIFW